MDGPVFVFYVPKAPFELVDWVIQLHPIVSGQEKSEMGFDFLYFDQIPFGQSALYFFHLFLFSLEMFRSWSLKQLRAFERAFLERDTLIRAGETEEFIRVQAEIHERLHQPGRPPCRRCHPAPEPDKEAAS